METNKIIIGITHGDINGIGYDVILKNIIGCAYARNFCSCYLWFSESSCIHRKNLDIQGINLNIVNSIEEINL